MDHGDMGDMPGHGGHEMPSHGEMCSMSVRTIQTPNKTIHDNTRHDTTRHDTRPSLLLIYHKLRWADHVRSSGLDALHLGHDQPLHCL